MVLAFSLFQNDVSDIPDLTFSMDADEEKHILYEKTEVLFSPSFDLCIDLYSIAQLFFLGEVGNLIVFVLLLEEVRSLVDHPC